MRALSFDSEAWEATAYSVSARREVTGNRPPRRESPRFASRRKGKGHISGMHGRCNKRTGL